MSESKTYEGWCVVELMGHVRMAGKVSEQEMFGAVLGRIDIPVGDGFVTQYFSGGSVYRLTPCGEAEARGVAAMNEPTPVHRYEFPKQALPQTEMAPAHLRCEEAFNEYDGDDDA